MIKLTILEYSVYHTLVFVKQKCYVLVCVANFAQRMIKLLSVRTFSYEIKLINGLGWNMQCALRTESLWRLACMGRVLWGIVWNDLVISISPSDHASSESSPLVIKSVVHLRRDPTGVFVIIKLRLARDERFSSNCPSAFEISIVSLLKTL